MSLQFCELRASYHVLEPDRPKFETSKSAAAWLSSRLETEPQECFCVLALDTRHRAVSFEIVTRGTVDGTLVDPGAAFRAAILSNSPAIIVAHNHPSGDPSPSGRDIEMTNRLRAAGTVLGIDVVDHVIIGHDGKYFSFKESLGG